jgi:hypothetical protein
MMPAQWEEIDRVLTELEFASEDSLEVEYTAGAGYFGEFTGSDYLLFVAGSGWHETWLSYMADEAISAGVSAGVGALFDALFGSDDDDDEDEYIYIDEVQQH